MERWKESVIDRAYAAAHRRPHELPPSLGICHILSPRWGGHSTEELVRTQREHNNTIAFLTRTFRTWPHFSGRIDYPVPGLPDAHSAYRDNGGSLWDTTTEYGRLRWDLLRHICMELAK